MMRPRHLILAAVCLTWAAPGPALAGKKPSKESAAAAAPAAAPSSKKALEAYLKDRSERIKQMHKSRQEFIAQETETWNTFWNKVKEDRLLFEVRIIRQRLDLFDSLASLESNSHAPSLVNFEKLQSEVIKTFEQQQKDKMTSFFADRDARSKSFAAQQEKDRAESVADAEAAWREQKGSLRGGESEPQDEKRKPAKKEAARREEAPKDEPRKANAQVPDEETEVEDVPPAKDRSSRKGDEGSAVRFGPP